MSGALKSFEGGDFADALIGAEYVCRRLPDNVIPAILRARILEACLPQLAGKAWYRAWYCDPENPALQDMMLRAWLHAGATESVAELGPAFLPARCRERNEATLLDFLRQAGVTRAGGCWRSGDNIEGIVHQLTPREEQGNERITLILSAGSHQFFHDVRIGERFSIACPSREGVWSLAMPGDGGDAGMRIMQGSPVVFSTEWTTGGPVAAARGRNRRAAKTIDIVIPVYRGHATAKACIESVIDSLAHNQMPAEIVVIDDASPEPDLAAWLGDLSMEGRITLLRNRYNLGFIETVNRGLRLHADRDVMLLNADTVVHGDWIDRLHAALYSGGDIASVTPWSNNGEITSFPTIAEAALAPTSGQAAELDRIAAELRRSGQVQDIELPACCGFAMMIRRAVLEKVGLLDGIALTRGYGEEVDWCQRARAAGYRHLAATGVFIAHTGTVSFRFEKRLRVRQNRAVLAARYPNYHPEYHAFLKDDPLRPARKALLAELKRMQNRWLCDAIAPQQANASPSHFLPVAAKSSCPRVAVWQHRLDDPFAGKILELARLVASRRIHARLLVTGEVSEALWHTGVVDAIPPETNNETSLLPDTAVIGLAGCTAVLSTSAQPFPANIAVHRIDDNFRPGVWLANWMKEQHARAGQRQDQEFDKPSLMEACIT